MNTPVEEIKSRLDLVELVQSYVRLHKAGINYKANCPFHGEKTPSFFVSPARQIWHCFGCGKGGDAFKFIMEIEGHDFPEALKLLAQRAGIVLKREDPRVRSERNRLYDICETGAQIFEKCLALTPAVRVYMQKRGVREDTLQEFRVGFAPHSWDFLLKALLQKGFKKEEIEKAGLGVKSQDGSSFYDRFRSRIMFPIADSSGRVVGFSGRIFGEDQRKDEAKYINTPQTLIYDKSRVLYGFDKAKQEIRAKNQAVIVEGQMDCVMSHQAGVKNTIAVSGTALTPAQLKTIKRLCDTIVSSFDTDTAGDTATKRSLALASQLEFACRVASIPSGKDPADAVLENPQLWTGAINSAKPVVEFYFEKAFREQSPATAQGKKAISMMILPWIAGLGNEIEKAHWVRELSSRLGIGEEAVAKELRKSGGNDFELKSEKEKPEIAKVPGRRELLEERVLALLPMVSSEIRTRELAEHHLTFATALNQNLFGALTAETPLAANADLQKHLDILKFKGEVAAQMLENAEDEFILCKRELEKECIKERLLKLGEEISQKERAGSQEAVSALLQDFHLLSDKLKRFSSR